ncbi:CGNR zinc finger domain-containing protein [Thermomonospora umbrina]|uniref:CGNR zinc finger protein n=1 Tax=Thermomonospora umbrina TaxID=111806 RepID=A0A3D9SML1_9ACTN|nr:CGNR zinc finger domain-containing protein [Thermomonospora umbrina]REE96967.1 CGNR zinc finger protein [Thermomonospora umbrina]
MQFNPYGGVAAQIAADLVNAGPDAAPRTLTELLVTHDYRPLMTVEPAEAERLAAWAGRLRPVFLNDDLRFRVDTVNALLASAASLPYISRHDGRPPHLHFAHEGSPLVQRLRAYTAAGLAHALCEDAERIGVCGREGCDTVYIDTSRNGRRRFCSTRCANRVHVADHRGRLRTITG